MTIDHVDYLQFFVVKLIGACGTAILDDNHVETLVGQATHGGRDALICEDTGNYHVPDAHVVKDQSQICSRYRAVGGLTKHDFVIHRREFGDESRFLGCFRHEEIVPAGLLLTK